MSCPQAKRCTLHDQLGTRSSLTVWQTLFCDSGFDRCVRYRLGAVGAAVPADLLPDGRSHLPRDPPPPQKAPAG
jgi:hypothetical protein